MYWAMLILIHNRSIEFDEFLEFIIARQGDGRDVHNEIVQVHVYIYMHVIPKLCSRNYVSRGLSTSPKLQPPVKLIQTSLPVSNSEDQFDGISIDILWKHIFYQCLENNTYFVVHVQYLQ